MQKLLQAATPPAPPAPAQAPIDPFGMQLSALVEQQLQSTMRLVQLEGNRVSLQKQLETSPNTQEKEMLNAQLRTVNGEIEGERAKIAQLKARVAEARNGIPDATPLIGVPPEMFNEPRMFGLSQDEFKAAFIFLLAFPLILAMSRRLWKIGMPSRAPRTLPLEDERLARLEQAVESVAIEVERISESQRFQSKLMAERQSPERIDAR
jgi:hypothetical protein